MRMNSKMQKVNGMSISPKKRVMNNPVDYTKHALDYVKYI